MPILVLVMRKFFKGYATLLAYNKKALPKEAGEGV
jgi:hypothetical protein